MRCARDQIADLVIAKLRTIPALSGRAYRDIATDGWDERTYPTVMVTTGQTRVDRLSDVEGYEILRRSTGISVDAGVREFAGEDPVDELSGLVVAIEDAMSALERESPIFETIDVIGLGEFVQVDDGDGGVTATQIEFRVDYYTQKGRAGEVLAG